MRNDVVKALELTGVDAIRFADSLFNPTVKQIEENRRRMEYIDSTVGIRETTGGFAATIIGLDLSFLKDSTVRDELEFEFTYSTDESVHGVFHIMDGDSTDRDGGLFICQFSGYTFSGANGCEINGFAA